jgi:TRAP-type mannitol/chloroaromatic compound transport system permease small subunit
MQGLLTISDGIDAVLERIAKLFAWVFVIMVTVIVFDVVSRKGGFQIPGMGSTRLQELQWYLHGMLFCTWLGYAYVKNAHVRIDILTGNLDQRKQAWLELFGCLVFALPYLLVALPYAHTFFMTSFLQNESSDAPNGVPWRWIPKGFLYFGFLSVLAAVVSVMIRRIVFLFGPPDAAGRALGSVGKAH